MQQLVGDCRAPYAVRAALRCIIYGFSGKMDLINYAAAVPEGSKEQPNRLYYQELRDVTMTGPVE